MNKKIYFVLFIFLSVLMFGGGLCWMTMLDHKTPAPADKQTPTATTTAGSATTTAAENLPVWPESEYTEKDYAGWKTYHNKILGYKIKYPADWTINDCDEGCASKEAIINPPNAEPFTSYISIGFDGRSIESIRSVFLDPNNYDGKPYLENDIFFSNMKCYQFFSQSVSHYRYIILPYKNTTYSISTDKDEMPEVLQALASFEFIEPSVEPVVLLGEKEGWNNYNININNFSYYISLPDKDNVQIGSSYFLNIELDQENAIKIYNIASSYEKKRSEMYKGWGAALSFIDISKIEIAGRQGESYYQAIEEWRISSVLFPISADECALIEYFSRNNDLAQKDIYEQILKSFKLNL